MDRGGDCDHPPRHTQDAVGVPGELMAVGVDGTGSYGAELARVLAAAGLTVIEVDRPDRKTRQQQGKSDPIDAYSAATAVASGRAIGLLKSRDGIVESIRCLRVARRSAVKARTQAINQIRALLITAPSGPREQLRPVSAVELVAPLSLLRPTADAADLSVAVWMALRSLARRHVTLNDEIDQLD